MNLTATYYFIRISFMNMLAYRARYYTGILTYTVHVAVHSSILLATHHAGMTHFQQAELMTFIAIGYIIRSCTFCNLDQEIGSQVTDGSMVMDMIKPLDYPGMQFARATGAMLFRLFVFTAPIVVVVFWVFDNIQGPQNTLQFVLSTFLAFWMFAQITFLIGLAAIKLHSINGIIRIKNHALNLLMGLTVPLHFIKNFCENYGIEWLYMALHYTPFPHMSHTPVMIYMNRLKDLETSSINEALFIQFVWAVGVTIITRIAWLRVKRHIMIQGG